MATGFTLSTCGTRAEDRVPIDFATTLRVGEALIPFRLTNVSQLGFSGVCGEELPVGAEVGLALPRLGETSAEVRWARRGRIGCRLVGGLSFNQLFFVLLNAACAGEEGCRPVRLVPGAPKA